MISVHTAGRKLRAERLVPRLEPGGHRVDAGGARAVRLIGGAVYRMRFLLFVTFEGARILESLGQVRVGLVELRCF